MKLKNKYSTIVLILFAVVGTACNSFAQPTSIPFPTAVISTSIPPTSALPIATLPASLQGLPTVPPQPQITLTPPTQPIQSPAKRISFASGATSATAQGNLAANSVDVYVLRVSGGQTIAVMTNSSTAMWLSVNGADGNVLKSMGAGTADWGGVAPTTQDYFLTVGSQNQAATSYTLRVSIPPLTGKRISFAPGETSITLQGTILINSMDRWVIKLLAGQTINAEAKAMNPNVGISVGVVGLDGDTPGSPKAGFPFLIGTAHTTQDYYIDVYPWIDTLPISYTLQVTVPPLGQEAPTPTPTRISFPPGGTSATMQGTLPAFGLNPYVLRAFAGQTLTVNLTTNPAGKGFLVIYGADGNVMISDHAGAQTWSGELPTTQDYNIHVRTGPDAASYTLQVIIPPVSAIDPRPAPKRISFAPGATTATVQGNLATTMPDVYVLRASAGQVMAVRLTASQGQATLMIAGADGTVLVPDRVKSTNSSGNLPSTQDYYIQVNPLVSPATYALQVTIPPLNLAPIRIVFQPGTTSSIVQGVVAPNATDRYALRALAGQTMTIKLLSTNNQAVVMVWGSDGQVLIPDQADATNWVSRLPATQDYLIDVWSIDNADVGYSLHIDVPPLK